MSQKGSFKISTGTSSILMIFVVLCLTTFAVLSYVTANADDKMTNTANKNIESYYKADANAQTVLEKIDSKLNEIKNIDDYISAFIDTAEIFPYGLDGVNLISEKGSPVIKFDIEIDSTSKLEVEIKTEFISGESKAIYKIIKYKKVSTIDWDIDELPGLWEG